MKKNAAVTLAVVGVMARGGVVLAEGEAPEPGSWQYRVALETGSLPADYFKVDTAKYRSSSETGPGIEVGGIVSRVGVDTGP